MTKKIQQPQKKLLIDSCENSVRMACLTDNKLTEIFIDIKNDIKTDTKNDTKTDTKTSITVDETSQKSIVGNVILGTVKRILPSRFAFIDIGSEKNAFMNLEEHHRLNLGEKIIVQVTKDATGTAMTAKGAKVQSTIRLKGRFVILQPSQDCTVGVSKKIADATERKRLRKLAQKLLPVGFACVLRTQSTTATYQDIQAEFAALQTLHTSIVQQAQTAAAPKLLHKEEFIYSDLLTDELQQIIVNNAAEYSALLAKMPQYAPKIKLWNAETSLFATYGIEHQITQALNRNIWLDSGGFVTFDPVEACVVIDVNTGKYSGKGGYRETALKINLEAAETIASQIALRNLSGIIIVDFVDMPSKTDQQKLLETFKTALNQLRIPPTAVSMTDFGLVQVARRKQREPLYKLLQTSCPCCNGLGRVTKIN
ncbi:MAG: ribonuclease E/G [Defluviitaleaceae bacterium]|nr:ribonuclease E/G [Defluviitaleaceae bacterium]